MDEPPKRYARGEKPVTKDYMLYDSFYMKCQEQSNACRQKVD